MDISGGQSGREERYARVLGAGDSVFSQMQPGDCAFVIESGAVEIWSEREGGRQVIARLGANDIFGEMALLGDQLRSASAVALEPTRLLVITQEHLNERLLGADPMTRLLLRTLVGRSREMLSRLRTATVPVTPLITAARPAPEPETNDQQAQDRQQAYGRLRVERELQVAMDDGEFQLYYQPIVALKDEHTAGFEALIRWRKPDGTFISPGEFIPVAEQSGLIKRLGQWILKSACEDLLRMDNQRQQDGMHGAPLFLTVNLSARQLEDPDLLSLLAQHVQLLQGRNCRLKLEITESLMIGNVPAMQAFIARCRVLGVQVVLDDFGTGYCSLSYLHLFEVHTMKLDRSFVRGMAVSDAAEKVVRGVVGIAHHLGLDIVAEGVESPEQAEQSRSLGVDYAQGYHFGRPMPLSQALKRLRPV